LRSLGFVVSGIDSSPTSIAIIRWGLVVDMLVSVLLQAKSIFEAIGILEKSKQTEDYARLVYKIIVGEDSSFDATYVGKGDV
jgi:hypothetical protein